MSLKTILRRNSPLTFVTRKSYGRSYSVSSSDSEKVLEKTSATEQVDITSADEKPVYEVEDALPPNIDEIRNKSRLYTKDRNILFGKPPYDESLDWHHDTLRYKRRMLGRFGAKALGNVPLGVAWPTVEEIEDKKEYERVAFPYTIQERWEKIAQKHKEEEEAIKAREKDIDEKMAKLDQWKLELQKKIEQKEKQLAEAKARKDRLVEEIRRHFGFYVSENDEKFKEMLVQKEVEEKKKQKEAKKKLKAERLLQRIKDLETGNIPKKDDQKNVAQSTNK